MIDQSAVPRLALSFLAGCALGVFYFGGLWLTVRRLAAAKRPALLLAGSFLLRIGLLLPALYVVMGGRWEHLLASLLGFYIARKWFVSHRYGTSGRSTA